VMRGDAAQEYAVRNHLSDKLILTDSFADALRQLAAGKHDAVLIQHLMGLQLIKQLHLSNLMSVRTFEGSSLKPAGQPLSGFEQKFCLAVHEGDKALLARLNEGLAIVIASGAYDALYDKWFVPILPQPAVDLARVARYLFLILVPLLALLGILGIWYLRREVDRKTRKLSAQILIRQETEESLIRTRDTLQAILDAAPAGVVVADRKGRILHSSRFAERFLGGVVAGRAHDNENGYRIATPDGTPVPPDRLPLSLALEGRSVLDTELLVTRSDGAPSTILASATPLMRQGPGHQIFGAVTVFQDITGRKRAEEALAASERQYRELIQTANSIIIRWDKDGVIRFINDYGLRFFGYREDELVGRTVALLVPKVEQSSGRDMELLIQDILRHPEAHTYVPNENITRDGRTTWVAWTNKAVLDDEGRVQEILAIGIDITALKEAERILRNSNLRLELLSTVSQRLLRAEDPQAIVEELCRLVMKHIDCQCFFNYLVAVPGRQMELNAYAGISKEDAAAIRRLDFGTAVCGCAARDGRRIIAENIGGSDDPRVQLVKSFGVKAYCCHPLQIGDRLIGTLSFGTKTRGYFTADEIELMQTVADKVALAMQRLQATQALRANERRLSLAISATADAVWEWNIATGETYYSPRWYAMLGYAGGEIPMSFESWKALCHPDDLQPTIDLIESRLKSTDDVGYAAEFRMRTKAGGWVWIMGRGRVVKRDADGNPVLLSGTNTDITDRKRAEEAMRQSEERLKRAQEIAHLGSWEVDLERNELIWSDEVYRIFGLAPGQFKATYEGFLAAVHPEDRRRVDETYTVSLHSGQDAYEVEHRVVRPDGEVRYVHEKCEHLRDGAGHPIRSVGMVHDITDSKRAAEALERSNQELEQFAYAASHDLQEPLRSIVGFLQLLEQRHGEQIDEQGRHYLERAAAAGRRMQTLIRDLLSLSRVTTRRGAYATTDLNRIVQDVLASLETTLQENQTQVICADLPTLRIDTSQIQSLFQNLVMNAVKYSQGPVPKVEIGCRRLENGYQFSVTDNGIGIDPRYHERIFMVFQRLHTEREYPGTGLGLALCKKIVERHGGRIWVESQLEQGATFHFTLPVTR
jgi:PAS domain S-box-containing protein